MLYINDMKSALPIFKALSSEIRLEILEMLTKYKQLNMNEIAEKLNLTNGAITMHIKKLEECGIIKVDTASGKHGNQKICFLAEDKMVVDISQEAQHINLYEVEIGVGLYSSYQVTPTCGLATKDIIIGEFDEPRYFADPQRINAGILWLSKGYVEYRIPNYLKAGQKLTEIQFSFELGSEAFGTCEDWPSDIYFYLNEIELGYWTSPGDFGNVKGRFTPVWWVQALNQYGLLKILTINKNGIFIDGLKISDISLNDLNLTYKSDFIFKLAVPDKARNIGGLTIYGKNFGNYNQDIKVRVLYDETNGT